MTQQELDALLYDCKCIGNRAKEIESQMLTLGALCKKQWIDNVHKKYPNVENPERFHWKCTVSERVFDLQILLDELQNALACMGKDVKFESAHDWVKSRWEGEMFNVKD